MEAFCECVDAKDIAITLATGQRALQAARAYRKVVGHEASLNFENCFVNVCALAQNARFFCKGNDFAGADLA